MVVSDLEVPDTIHFDPNGDVRLLVPAPTPDSEETAKTFIVSSRVMGLACNAWDRMLNGHFKESQGAGADGDVREVAFPDDDAAALMVLLNIIHLRFKEVPYQLPFATLVELAVLTDKYDLTTLVRPWYFTWMAGMQGHLLAPGFEQWLWVAWEFGHLDNFKTLADHLVRTVRVNGSLSEDGRLMCVTQGGKVLDPLDISQHMPPDIIENIIAIQQKVISAILDVYYKTLENYTSAYNSGRTVCQSEAGKRFECDAMAFGSLVLPLQQTGLGLVRTFAATEQLSVEELSAKLQGIQVMHYHEESNCISKGMDKVIREIVQSMVSSIPCPLLPSHLSHIARQREILN
ncbi:uncharacterized protein K452DRAFT_158783 [Aplosporella prunicola CBS 121167]|uniref:BTB domain-containing protein n=1 Tax=Aplosporella prunicola CBS 121167 TaxID=1176127 RepID=A0A6A6AVT6_9PEZI|nr:uncharacterized protein K452DRAFT_158783 [Aplosporella prunicola CBS 121167]KAF2135810.1 hypothetical protein K452DRAFT_158783 [Aplosporella prunicola CBS 121167]